MTSDPSLDEVFAGLPVSLTVQQVADLLHTSTRTVNRALNSGKLPGHKPLGEWVVFRDQLRRCLEDHAEFRKNHLSE